MEKKRNDKNSPLSHLLEKHSPQWAGEVRQLFLHEIRHWDMADTGCEHKFDN